MLTIKLLYPHFLLSMPIGISQWPLCEAFISPKGKICKRIDLFLQPDLFGCYRPYGVNIYFIFHGFSLTDYGNFIAPNWGDSCVIDVVIFSFPCL